MMARKNSRTKDISSRPTGGDLAEGDIPLVTACQMPLCTCALLVWGVA